MPELLRIGDVFGAILLAGAVFLPMFVGLFGLFRITADAALRASPIAALPALALSVSTPAILDLPDFLLGSHLASGGSVSVWLFVTATLWFGSAWFGVYYLAREKRRGLYAFFFLGSMSGNIGLVVARDMAQFLAFFSLMSFMAYGLVVHDRRPESMRAGRVYLAMAVLGEALQLAGLSLVAFPMVAKGDPLLFRSIEVLARTDALPSILFIGGFGVKAGLLGLHMWLPMAHPVAPTPASAVLSGSMIKAGLIGWINLLPLGFAKLSGLGTAVTTLGLAGALAAALAGSVQKQPKAVLAYSSVSQMGLIIAVFGIGLAHPDAWNTLLWVVIVYAAHHAFAKCLLFLSVGLKTTRPLGNIEAWVFWSGTGIAALALAGAPATSGMAAKLVLKEAVEAAASDGTDLVLLSLTLAAVGTTLLMARFVDVLRKVRRDEDHTSPGGIFAPWLLLLFPVCVFAWYLAARQFPASIAVWNKAQYWISGLWPVALGVALYPAGRKICFLFPDAWRIPPGDIYILFARVFSALIRHAAAARDWIATGRASFADAVLARARLFAKSMVEIAGRIEGGFGRWRLGGAVVVMIGTLFFWLAFR